MEKMEEFRKFLEEVKYYKGRINGISIQIEERDPNFVYLIHNTSLSQEDVIDVYSNGVAYIENDIKGTFNNLSQCWDRKNNPWKNKTDITSMEQVIVESCNSDFQCFVYKVPLSFFEPVDSKFYPIPIWYYDQSYVPKFNMSSSRVRYDATQNKYFRIYPTLLLGHYDLKSNSFHRNTQYSCSINNSNGIYDIRQLFNFGIDGEYSDLWKHNEYILSNQVSPFQEEIDEICDRFSSYLVDEKSK